MIHSVWGCFLVALWYAMSCIGDSRSQRFVEKPDVRLDAHQNKLFLTGAFMVQQLTNRQLIGGDQHYGAVQWDAIERELTQLPEVKRAEVYAYLSGQWVIEVEFRQPVARIFNRDGSGCYLDKEGKLIPLSKHYTAHVITVDGAINETDYTKNVTDIINSDSLITIEQLDDVYAISNYVCSDEWLSAQLTHMHITPRGEFELTPRVGDQRILFGGAHHVAGKFKKLRCFYREAMNRIGWKQYRTIDLRYQRQIVCKKK